MFEVASAMRGTATIAARESGNVEARRAPYPL